MVRRGFETFRRTREQRTETSFSWFIERLLSLGPKGQGYVLLFLEALGEKTIAYLSSSVSQTLLIHCARDERKSDGHYRVWSRTIQKVAIKTLRGITRSAIQNCLRCDAELGKCILLLQTLC